MITQSWYIATAAFPCCFTRGRHTGTWQNTINTHPNTRAGQGTAVLTSRALHWLRVSHNAPSHTLSWKAKRKRERVRKNKVNLILTRLWLVSNIKDEKNKKNKKNGTGSRPSSNAAEFKWNLTDKSKWRKMNYVLFFFPSLNFLNLLLWLAVQCLFCFIGILIFSRHSSCIHFCRL